jgi:hypothetical protein
MAALGQLSNMMSEFIEQGNTADLLELYRIDCLSNDIVTKTDRHHVRISEWLRPGGRGGQHLLHLEALSAASSITLQILAFSSQYNTQQLLYSSIQSSFISSKIEKDGGNCCDDRTMRIDTDISTLKEIISLDHILNTTKFMNALIAQNNFVDGCALVKSYAANKLCSKIVSEEKAHLTSKDISNKAYDGKCSSDDYCEEEHYASTESHSLNKKDRALTKIVLQAMVCRYVISYSI